MSRKDSKGMFAAVLGQLGEDREQDVPALRSSSPHLMKVAAGVRQMQERSDLAERLLRSGDQIIEFDPESILPSNIPDRFDDAYQASAIAEIVASMRERGQIVPGLVRPIPGREGAFQIVYGRRRLAAARQLGTKFKASVRELTDEQAVVFQGEENTARDDLSFIEKCAFALAQEEAGYTRETICASLSTGKSHVSEMIKLASTIGRDILQAIGKAPGIGRGRWEEFSRRYGFAEAETITRNLIRRGKFLEASSDDRFIMLLDSLPIGAPASAEHHPRTVKPQRQTRSWAPIDRSVSVNLKDNGKTATIAIGAADGPRFAEFITRQLDGLYEAFRKSEQETAGE
jgi:ParB family chromosome partitioning protein